MRTTIGIKMSLLAKKVGLSRQKNGEIHVSILTIPTIWTKFNKWLRDWQGTAMIGLGSNKNMPSWYISCHFVHNIVQITESFFFTNVKTFSLNISVWLDTNLPKVKHHKILDISILYKSFIAMSVKSEEGQCYCRSDWNLVLAALSLQSENLKNYFLSKNPNNSWWNKHFHSGQVHTHQRTILAGQSSLKGLF